MRPRNCRNIDRHADIHEHEYRYRRTCQVQKEPLAQGAAVVQYIFSIISASFWPCVLVSVRIKHHYKWH
jgi:hypothetical protein